MIRGMTSPGARDLVFRALADPNRRRILDLLGDAERPVGDIHDALPVSQPAVSQHLRSLREAGLVRMRRSGRERLYRRDPRPLESVADWIARHLGDASGRRRRPKEAR
jgi:DNA-binding transcriptional ArsR family regulator